MDRGNGARGNELKGSKEWNMRQWVDGIELKGWREWGKRRWVEGIGGMG